MITCPLTKEQLSAYLDGIMTAEERRLVEDHLSTCGQCGLAFSELKDAREVLRNLEEVEPPPWFTQKIMNRVREDAESKKGLLQKLFYPFHIKIPIEALATCLVVVLALFIYKNAGLDMKVIDKPEEVAAVSPQAQLEKHDDKASLAIREKDSQADESLKKGSPDKFRSNEAPALSHGTGGSVKDTLPPPAAPSESRVAKKDIEEAESRYEAGRTLAKQEAATEKKVAAAPAQKPATAPPAKLKEESVPSPVGSATMAAREADKARPSLEAKAVSISERKQFLFSVSTNNIETAVTETEKLLKRFGAANITKTNRQPNVVAIGADLPGQKIKDFFNALKTVGTVKEKQTPENSQQEFVPISIEITANP